MKAEIYYFSGTGNSLIVARDLARELDGRLIPISTLKDRSDIKIEADVMGIVFPVYHASFGESGIPNIVEEFIEKLTDIHDKYIFAICTHAGMPAFTIRNMRDLIKHEDGELSAGFSVKMGVPYTTSEKIKHVFLKKSLTIDEQNDKVRREELSRVWEADLEKIVEVVKDRKNIKIDTPGRVSQVLLRLNFILQKPMAVGRYRKLSGASDLPYRELTRFADRSFIVNDSCTGCGICQKVCPADNIEIRDGKPVWKNSCENCFACYHWCPTGAISGEIAEYEKRTHYPDVTITDMLMKKR